MDLTDTYRYFAGSFLPFMPQTILVELMYIVLLRSPIVFFISSGMLTLDTIYPANHQAVTDYYITAFAFRLILDLSPYHVLNEKIVVYTVHFSGATKHTCLNHCHFDL